MTGLLTLIFLWQMCKGAISRPVNDVPKLSILTKSLLAKKCPKLGIHIPNAGDDNQSYLITSLEGIKASFYLLGPSGPLQDLHKV